MPVEKTLWRVFPWDPDASEGDHFSPQFVPPPATQGSGRFDLPRSRAAVTYFAESPDHAIAELLQGFRGHTLEPADLMRYGRRLALVNAVLAARPREGIFDFCSAAELVKERIAPDATAARHRLKTQRSALQLHAAGHAGLRWWSTFFGEWHTVVLFRDRINTHDLEFAAPLALDLKNPHLIEAARLLDVVVETASKT